MKTSKLISTCFAVISLFFFFFACANISVSKAQATKTALIKKAEAILKSIAFADFEAVGKSIHEDRGLQFSPYDQEILLSKKKSEFPNCMPNMIKFTKKQTTNFMHNKKTYIWGQYDGSGDEIALIPKLYYKEFIYDMDYLNMTEACVFDNEGLKKNNEFINIYNAYPNSWLVQYHYKGTSEYGFVDYRDLFLIFEYLENQWFLVGIIHGEKTI